MSFYDTFGTFVIGFAFRWCIYKDLEQSPPNGPEWIIFVAR